MGRELECRVDSAAKPPGAKRCSRTSEILFRGGFRLKIPFQSIRAMDAAGGKLTVQFPEGSAVFHLGDRGGEVGRAYPESAQPAGQAGSKGGNESAPDRPAG